MLGYGLSKNESCLISEGAIMNSVTNKMFSTLQKVGQSLMTPVSVLPAAGLLVALGRVLDNHLIGKLIFSGGLAIFEQLPVVFESVWP